MKVGINAMLLARDYLSGIEVYTTRLIEGLISRGVDLELYSCNDLTRHDFPAIVQSSRIRNAGSLRKLLWDQFTVTSLIGADTTIFHGPHFSLPRGRKNGVKYVVTIHDFAYSRYPHLYDWRTALFHNLAVKSSLSAADRIICCSKSGLDDLAGFFPEFLSKGVVVHHGCDDFSAIKEDETILQELDLVHRRFVLSIGTHPRKNLGGSVAALERVRQRLHDLTLVVVGHDPGGLERKTAFANKGVVFTGFISQQRLAALYKSALVLLFPSFYEGFGLPVLEAMTCDLPVITSRNSSLIEVSNFPQNWLVDPEDVGDIATKLERIIEDRSWRKQLIDHGRKQVARFSWQKMVDGTVAVYRSLGV